MTSEAELLEKKLCFFSLAEDTLYAAMLPYTRALGTRKQINGYLRQVQKVAELLPHLEIVGVLGRQ